MADREGPGKGMIFHANVIVALEDFVAPDELHEEDQEVAGTWRVRFENDGSDPIGRALDLFHEKIAIGHLDDFRITCHLVEISGHEKMAEHHAGMNFDTVYRYSDSAEYEDPIE